MKHNSCYNCTKREIGCHDKCEEYADWKTEHDDLMKKIHDDRVTAYALIYNGKW